MSEERGARSQDPVRADIPNVARMYDYYLGGKDNFQADRDAAERVLEAVPEVRRAVRANRAFLGRAVRFLAGEAGVRQFIDIGTGLPTQDNTHQVAQRHSPDVRVVYVDNDPVVLTHARALLATDEKTTVAEGDMRRPQEILANPRLRAHLDLDRPVAVLLLAMLHFMPEDEDACRVVARLRDAVTSGSYLVMSHGTGGGKPAAATSQVRQVYDQATAQITPRTREQVMRLFDGFDLVDPGVVPVHEWRPDADVDPIGGAFGYAAVGRKP